MSSMGKTMRPEGLIFDRKQFELLEKSLSYKGTFLEGVCHSRSGIKLPAFQENENMPRGGAQRSGVALQLCSINRSTNN